MIQSRAPLRSFPRIYSALHRDRQKRRSKLELKESCPTFNRKKCFNSSSTETYRVSSMNDNFQSKGLRIKSASASDPYLFVDSHGKTACFPGQQANALASKYANIRIVRIPSTTLQNFNQQKTGFVPKNTNQLMSSANRMMKNCKISPAPDLTPTGVMRAPEKVGIRSPNSVPGYPFRMLPI